MSTLMDELTAIKAVEDKLTANKVANFAYTDHAYNNPLTEADGVASYDPDAEQNIPNANASTLQVNPTILTKGWRAQASSITRMLMNHFLGRCSYNLNKINDLFSTLLTKLMAYMGVADGLATLDENGYVPLSQLNITKSDLGLGNVVNTGDSATPVENGTNKFTTGGMFNFLSSLFEPFTEGVSKHYYEDEYYFYNGKVYACNQSVQLSTFDSQYFSELRKIKGVGLGLVYTFTHSEVSQFHKWRFPSYGIQIIAEDTGSSWELKDGGYGIATTFEYGLIRGGTISYGKFTAPAQGSTTFITVNANETVILFVVGDMPAVYASW